MATDAVNWAYQYSLACAKLVNAENTAGTSNSRSADIATAKADFNATMKSLLPSDAQSSVQVQCFDALTTYNTSMASADTQATRASALDTLYDTLGGITIPTSSTTTSSTTTASNASYSNASVAAYSAGLAGATSGATPGDIMNAALVGYILASQAEG